MVFLVINVSVFNNFIPTLTKAGTFTFANSIVTNCLSVRKFPHKEISYKWSQLKKSEVCVISIDF